LAVLLALAGCAAIGVYGALTYPPIVGTYLDDGVYLATGKALAEGKGYRHIEYPGQPYQTKYPILFPLLLSAVWRIFPNFPRNILAVQVINIVLWTVGSWIAYRLMCRTWKLPGWLGGSGVVLAFLCLQTLSILPGAMSEPLYMLVSLAALWVLAGRPSERSTDQPGEPGLVQVAVGAVLAGAAYLTRSIGVTLVAAVVVGCLLRRAWKQVGLAVLIALLAVGGWQAWCVYAGSLNANLPAASGLRYDLDYRAWVVTDLRTLAWVAYHNISELALSWLEAFGNLDPDSISNACLKGGLGPALPIYVGMLVVGVLTVGGLWLTWDRRQPVIHLYLLFSFGLMLLWPFSPSRFLVPLLPLLTTLQLGSLYQVVTAFAGWLHVPEEPGPQQPLVTDRWSGQVPGAGAGFRVVMAVVMVLTLLRVIPALRPNPEAVVQLKEDNRQREALVELLRAKTPPEAIISSPYAPYMHLRTGRTFVPPSPADDPVSLRYAPDRKFSQCGRVTTPGMLAADLRYHQTRWVDFLRRTGVTHLVTLEKRNNSYWAVLAEQLRTFPNRFQFVDAADSFLLYRVRFTEP